MSEKKGGLSAFLAKQKKGKKKQDNTANPADTTANAGPTVVEEAKEQVDKTAKKTEEKKEDPKAKKQGDSSEEEDEGDLTYGVIVDKNFANNSKQQTKVDYFENQAESKTADAKPAKKAEGPSEIKFGGGKPKFGRGKGKLGGEFSKGLDDLDGAADDDANQSDDNGPKQGNDRGTFINLSSSFKRGTDARNFEEEKRDSRPAAVKPTFRGKANLTRTGDGEEKQQDNAAGGNRTYDFQVAFRGQGDDKPRENRNEENKADRSDTTQRGGLGGGRGRRGRGGRGFGPSQAQQDEDEGFEVVRFGRKPRNKNRDNSSDSDETPAQGGGRGGRGRGRGDRGGGFFTNSGKNRVVEKTEEKGLDDL